jgi:ADP-ribosylglycohydrolase
MAVVSLGNRIKGMLFGCAIGDALGVPVEFRSRDKMDLEPVSDFLGYMCWNQPPGTFSDDSSMLFCTTESLIAGYNLNDMAQKFVAWMNHGYWGAHDEVFDIGGSTRASLMRIEHDVSPKYSGDFEDFNNGNGSLMRIAPLIPFLLNHQSLSDRYRIVKEVSSISHGHFRSVLACFIYVEFGRNIILLDGDLKRAYAKMQQDVVMFCEQSDFNAEELKLFDKILEEGISSYSREEIFSSGYVLHSLEAALWCFLTSESYDEVVLKAVNLGGDTDTTAAIAGALTGLYFGKDGINSKWLRDVVKSNEIEDLSLRFCKSLNNDGIHP